MPKVKTRRTMAPEGWDLIEPTLTQLDAKMRDAEAESHEGKRKTESLWPIFRIHHQRSRYIYEMYYKKHAISKELYEYCIREGYADGNLIAKWKKPGYDRVCCLRCIQTRDSNFGTTCICRVPKSELEPGRIVQCVHCGCRGCATGDGAAELLDLRAGAVKQLGDHSHAHEHAADADDTSERSHTVGSDLATAATNAGPAPGTIPGMPMPFPGMPFPFPMPSFLADGSVEGMPAMPFPFPMPMPMPGFPMPFFPGMMPFPGMPFPTAPGGDGGAETVSEDAKQSAEGEKPVEQTEQSASADKPAGSDEVSS